MSAVKFCLRQRGFSVLEMAVVMSIIGFIAVLVPRLVSNVVTLQSSVKSVQPHELALASLTGFALAQHRLPCPDVDRDGIEDCSGAARRGGLPYRSLGLPAPLLNTFGFPFDYAVYRGGDENLTAVPGGFAPALPESNSTSTVWNGLDFCQALRVRGAALSPAEGEPSAGGVEVPFLIADPGAGDADGDGDRFDESNVSAGLAFASADRPRSDRYDDIVHASSYAVLLGQLDCARYIAAASGAAREANASWDIWRAAVFYEAFREHGLRVRENAKESADFKYLMAVYVNTVLTAALVANDLAVALSSGSGAGAIAVASINSVIAVASAVYGVIEATESKAGAASALTEAQTQKTNATTNKTRARDYYVQSVSRARVVDQRGWHQ